MVIQSRDRDILDFLRTQGFATFGQIEKHFFPSKTVCSRRLLLLKQLGYLRVQSLRDIFFVKKAGSRQVESSNSVPLETINDREGGELISSFFFPYLLGLGIKSNVLIYSLSANYRSQINETNRLLKKDLCIHQLLLNDIFFYLSKTLQSEFILSDPKIKILSKIDFSRPLDFTPDLAIESKNICIAVELERTIKSMNRYLERFHYYQNSNYSHVIYYYVKESHLKTLLDYVGTVSYTHLTLPTNREV